MIVSMEKLFSEKELAIADFPRHHFVLVPLGDGQMNGLSSGDQWNGVLNALKSEIGELKKSQRMKMEELKRMRETLREVEDRVIQKVEERVGQMEENLLTLLREMNKT
jgi:hypothetical protein